MNNLLLRIDEMKFERSDSMLKMADIILTCIFSFFCYPILPSYAIRSLFSSTLECVMFIVHYFHQVFHSNAVTAGFGEERSKMADFTLMKINFSTFLFNSAAGFN